MSIRRSPATRRTAVVNWFSPPKGCATVNSENTAPRLTVPRVAGLLAAEDRLARLRRRVRRLVRDEPGFQVVIQLPQVAAILFPRHHIARTVQHVPLRRFRHQAGHGARARIELEAVELVLQHRLVLWLRRRRRRPVQRQTRDRWSIPAPGRRGLRRQLRPAAEHRRENARRGATGPARPDRRARPGSRRSCRCRTTPLERPRCRCAASRACSTRRPECPHLACRSPPRRLASELALRRWQSAARNRSPESCLRTRGRS